MAKKSEGIKIQRQVQITIPSINVILISEHDDETIDYLTEKAVGIVDKYVGRK